MPVPSDKKSHLIHEPDLELETGLYPEEMGINPDDVVVEPVETVVDTDSEDEDDSIRVDTCCMESQPTLYAGKTAKYVTFSGIGPSDHTMMTCSNISKPTGSIIQSHIDSVQIYLPGLRNFNAYSKGPTSTTKAFGFNSQFALQEDGSVILKVQDLQDANFEHFEQSLETLEVLSKLDTFLNRIEMKISVPSTSQFSLADTYIETLQRGFQDLSVIINSASDCVSAKTYIDLMQINSYSLYGVSLSMNELSNDLSSSEHMHDFVSAYGELQAHGFNQWTGRNAISNKRIVAPRLQYLLKRPLFSPFNFHCSAKLMALPRHLYGINLQEMYSTLLQDLSGKNFIAVSDMFERDLCPIKQALMSPLLASYQDTYYRKGKLPSIESANVCKYCWTCFPPTIAGSNLCDQHPCVGLVDRSSCLISMNSNEFRKHMEQEVTSLDTDQIRIANWILDRQSSVFIFGPAGSGKSKVLQILR
jgi:hypothetical protein